MFNAAILQQVMGLPPQEAATLATRAHDVLGQPAFVPPYTEDDRNSRSLRFEVGQRVEMLTGEQTATTQKKPVLGTVVRRWYRENVFMPSYAAYQCQEEATGYMRQWSSCTHTHAHMACTVT